MALKGVQLGEGGRDGQPPLPPYSPPPEEAPLPTMGYVGEPICPGLGVDYPFPPHLEYLYPPPDGNILTNIVNALIAVPRLYTQVLHLMNKMNLPAPFRPAMPTPPLPPLQPPECVPPPPPEHQAADLSSGESELESSDEGEVESMDPDKVKAEQQHENSRKRKRPGAVLGPAADKEASHEAAGVKSATLTAKESSSVKKKQPVMQIKIAARGIAAESGHERKMKVAESPVDDISEAKGESPGCATREELLAGRVPPEELLSLPTFKNYTPGNPTAVLYLKNLAKDVTVEDLYHIFGAFFAGPDEAKAALNIKLMQEGRMRGQAFVTFPRTEMAAESLSTTNGFLLKGKPMIVQFGRNPSGAKAPA